MTIKASTNTMQKYIDQTQQLDSERQALVSRLSDDTLSDSESDSILKRLEQIYQAQSSNAIILADMLSQVLSED